MERRDLSGAVEPSLKYKEPQFTRQEVLDAINRIKGESPDEKRITVSGKKYVCRDLGKG